MKNLKTLLALLLAAALLAGCGAPQAGPAETDAPTEQPAPAADSEEAVVVTDVTGLLNALAPGAVIEIDAEQLALDHAPDYGFSYSAGAYTWEQIGWDEYALVIRDLEGLTIRGRGAGGTQLTTGAASATVLTLRGCRDVTLEGLTLGHRGEPGFCSGDVRYCDSCEDVTVRSCDLFGCGVTAVNAWKCTRLFLEGCTMRDCRATAVNATLCTNVQARDCAILRCGQGYGIAALSVASCNGFALINSEVRDGKNSCLLDEMNSSSVCLLGCEASGNSFSEALFRIYDGGVTVSGCALADNEFGKCYATENCFAVTGSGKALVSFADFTRMERKPFEGEYIGPAPYVTPGDIENETYVTPGDLSQSAPAPAPAWDGEQAEVHVSTVDELLAAIAPHTTVYLDGEEFDLSTASDYGSGSGLYYAWIDTYDGPGLVLHDLDGFALVGGGMGVTLLSAVPRYADVLYFENCRDISLTDMTLGHRIEPGYCAGNVVELMLCTGATIERCGLFGCGVIGICADNCSDLVVSESNIYDCSYLGAQLDNVEDAVFTGCSVTNCGGEYGFNGLFLNNCSGVFFDTELLVDGEYRIGAAG